MAFIRWWHELELIYQLLWGSTIVSSLLLMILVILSMYTLEASKDKQATNTPYFSLWWLLVFSCFASWGALVLMYLTNQIYLTLGIAIILGGLGVYAVKKLRPVVYKKIKPLDQLKLEEAKSSTAEVLRVVPPHRNGFGQIHLDSLKEPYALEAITAGKELPVGCTVRIIDIIDDRVVLVEPVDGPKYPGQRQ